jgi:hypothetical protein
LKENARRRIRIAHRGEHGLVQYAFSTAMLNERGASGLSNTFCITGPHVVPQCARSTVVNPPHSSTNCVCIPDRET